MGKSYTGVDIGSASVKLAVCDDGAIKTIVVEALPEGLMADGHLVSLDATADFIKGLAKRAGGIAKDVAFVLPSTESLVRRLSIPAMTIKELELNLPYEFRDYISQGKDRYEYDYVVLAMHTDAAGVPESMDLLAAAAMKQTIADYQEMFRRAGMRMRIALPAQAAFQNLVGGNPRALANCCVIDFSHAATKLHFFTDGAYDVTRIIEIGGIDIDRAIASAYGVDEHVANSYKLTDYEDAQACQAAVEVYESIAVEIGRALNFYGFNNPDTSIEVAYCCGGGAYLQMLVNTVAAHTDVELRSIADIMPEVANADGGPDKRLLCPAAVGATEGRR